MDTGDLLISGMGELHLEVVVTRIIKEWGLEVRSGKPQVERRESIAGSHHHTERLARQMTGVHQQVEVRCSVRPQPRGAGNAVTIDIDPETQKKLSFSWEQTVATALAGGIALGYPAIDVGVTVSDLRYRENEGVDTAIRAALSTAVGVACRHARPILLSPVMRVDITTPKEGVGEMLGALNQRDALIQAVESKPHGEHICAEVALEKLFGFSTVVRSATRGRGEFSMEFVHYK